jgi:DinB superfamily
LRSILWTSECWQNGHADIWRVFDDGDAFGEVVAALIAPWRKVRDLQLVGRGVTHRPYATLKRMELERRTAELYVRHAFDQMLAVADRLGDDRVNDRPLEPAEAAALPTAGAGARASESDRLPRTNAVAALVIHSCAVTEFWIGHVALGRPSRRDRESEFTSTATVGELHALVDATMEQLSDDLAAIDEGRTQPDRTGRQFLEGGDESDGAIVLHVLEELYQHLGHMELAADALTIRG